MFYNLSYTTNQHTYFLYGHFINWILMILIRSAYLGALGHVKNANQIMKHASLSGYLLKVVKMVLLQNLSNF